MLALQSRIGNLETVEHAPTDIGLQVRIRGGDTDPAHLSLLLHLLQGCDQVSALALLDARVVQLHHIDVVGSHPGEALVQTAEQVLLGPNMGSVVGALVAAYYRAAALCGQYELIAAVREEPADVLLAAPVVVGCVDEVDATVDDRLQDLLRLGVLDSPAAPDSWPAHLHRAITQPRHRQTCTSQHALRQRHVTHETPVLIDPLDPASLRLENRRLDQSLLTGAAAGEPTSTRRGQTCRSAALPTPSAATQLDGMCRL